MLIDGANSGHKTGIEEGFDAGAKFHGGLLASMGDIGFQSARRASMAARLSASREAREEEARSMASARMRSI